MPISQSRKALLGQTASVVWPWFLLGKRSSACGSPSPTSTSCCGDNAGSNCCDGNDCCDPNAINYIVKSLLEIVFHDERPAYEPYVMPENIRGFLRGKHDQGTARPAAQTQASEGCSCC